MQRDAPQSVGSVAASDNTIRCGTIPLYRSNVSLSRAVENSGSDTTAWLIPRFRSSDSSVAGSFTTGITDVRQRRSGSVINTGRSPERGTSSNMRATSATAPPELITSVGYRHHDRFTHRYLATVRKSGTRMTVAIHAAAHQSGNGHASDPPTAAASNPRVLTCVSCRNSITG